MAFLASPQPLKGRKEKTKMAKKKLFMTSKNSPSGVRGICF
jgi:hypothetical protein